VTPDIGLAAAHFGAANYQATCVACQAILRQDPRHFDALHLLGVALSRLNRHDEALVWMRAAAAQQPDHALLRTNLCNAHLMLKDYGAAITAAQHALRLAPNDMAAWNNLGLAHKGLGQTDAAIAAFRHAIGLRWDNAQAWFNLAGVLGKAGRLEEALDAVRTAQRAAPLDTPLVRMADITNEISLILMALGRHRQALAECRRFLRRHPDVPSVRWNLSLVLLLLGEYAQGWRAYESRWDVADHDPLPEGATVLDPARVAGPDRTGPRRHAAGRPIRPAAARAWRSGQPSSLSRPGRPAGGDATRAYRGQHRGRFARCRSAHAGHEPAARVRHRTGQRAGGGSLSARAAGSPGTLARTSGCSRTPPYRPGLVGIGAELRTLRDAGGGTGPVAGAAGHRVALPAAGNR
jgi:Flp pilus assembly protein TadD